MAEYHQDHVSELHHRLTETKDKAPQPETDCCLVRVKEGEELSCDYCYAHKLSGLTIGNAPKCDYDCEIGREGEQMCHQPNSEQPESMYTEATQLTLETREMTRGPQKVNQPEEEELESQQELKEAQAELRKKREATMKLKKIDEEIAELERKLKAKEEEHREELQRLFARELQASRERFPNIHAQVRARLSLLLQSDDENMKEIVRKIAQEYESYCQKMDTFRNMLRE